MVNPYIGCEFGCLYCYASFMGRFVGESTSDWGRYVKIKCNAAEVLRAQVTKLSSSGTTRSVLLSSVTDPYQPVESRFLVTQGILRVLADAAYPGTVSILTKSPLVLRDVGILKDLPCLEVGMTTTSTDDAVSQSFEVYAPLVSRRFRCLEQLSYAGLRTYAFIGPLLPHYYCDPSSLERLFCRLNDVGVHTIYVEHLNTSPHILARLDSALRAQAGKVREAYGSGLMETARSVLDVCIGDLVARFKMELRLGKPLEHGKTPAPI